MPNGMDSVDFADATRNPPTFEEFEENVGEALVSAISAAFPDRDIGESVAAIRDLSSEYDLSFSDAVLVATAIDGDPEVSGLADFAIARPCLESFGTCQCNDTENPKHHGSATGYQCGDGNPIDRRFGSFRLQPGTGFRLIGSTVRTSREAVCIAATLAANARPIWRYWPQTLSLLLVSVIESHEPVRTCSAPRLAGTNGAIRRGTIS